jgi:hypothetical protein
MKPRTVFVRLTVEQIEQALPLECRRGAAVLVAKLGPLYGHQPEESMGEFAERTKQSLRDSAARARRTPEAELERCAREVLAREYERSGMTEAASGVRQARYPAIVRAIMTGMRMTAWGRGRRGR